jgi:hypothetical protein
VRAARRLVVDVEHGAFVFVLAAFGASVPALVYLGDIYWWEDPGELMSTPEFVFWAIAASVQGAVWAILIPTIIRTLFLPRPVSVAGAERKRGAQKRTLWEYRHGRGREILTPTILFSALIFSFVIPSFRIPPPLPLPAIDLKIGLLSVAPGAIALSAGVGIWLVHAALDADFSLGSPREWDLEEYVWLRDRLRGLLLVEATLLSVMIIGTAAMRNAIVALDPSTEFPPAWVMLYGAFFTTLLALA